MAEHPYSGPYRDYVPLPDDHPTPLVVVDGVEPQNAQARVEGSFRTPAQGRYSLEFPHNYSHGHSRSRLRPSVDDRKKSRR